MKKILSLAFAGAVLACLSFTPMSNVKTVAVKNKIPCPLIQLSSPPSTITVGCSRPQCNQSLTVNTTMCSPFTFHFNWSGGSCNASTASGSGVLSFTGCGCFSNITPGTIISL
ncbi:MAG: hypothetical protein ACXVED_17400, partial [Bacteroidia bacterium]